MSDDPGAGPRIRPEHADDPEEVAAIDALLQEAFPGQTTQRRLVRAMRRSPDHRPASTLVALGERGEPVGYVMVSAARLDGPEGRTEIAALAPLAVAPAQQGRGLGGALLDAAAAAAAAGGSPVLVLEGPPAYYSRHGFLPGPALGIVSPLTARLGDGAPLVRPLDGYGPGDTGRVVYSDVIAATEPD